MCDPILCLREFMHSAALEAPRLGQPVYTIMSSTGVEDYVEVYGCVEGRQDRAKSNDGRAACKDNMQETTCLAS